MWPVRYFIYFKLVRVIGVENISIWQAFQQKSLQQYHEIDDESDVAGPKEVFLSLDRAMIDLL